MVDFLLSSHGLFAYLLVFGVLLASSLGAPIPEDLTLIVAGIMSSHETVQTGLMALTCYLGILAGDLIIYRIGWLAGPALFRKQWFRKHLTTRRLQLIRENLDRRTILTILVARHLFYIRTATFLMCGAVRLPFARFFLIDAFAALITVPLMMGLGYLFAHNYSEILGFMRQLKVALLVLGIIAAVLIVWRFKRNKHRTHEANPSIESEDAPEG